MYPQRGLTGLHGSVYARHLLFDHLQRQLLNDEEKLPLHSLLDLLSTGHRHTPHTAAVYLYHARLAHRTACGTQRFPLVQYEAINTAADIQNSTQYYNKHAQYNPHNYYTNNTQRYLYSKILNNFCKLKYF